MSNRSKKIKFCLILTQIGSIFPQQVIQCIKTAADFKQLLLAAQNKGWESPLGFSHTVHRHFYLYGKGFEIFKEKKIIFVVYFLHLSLKSSKGFPVRLLFFVIQQIILQCNLYSVTDNKVIWPNPEHIVTPWGHLGNNMTTWLEIFIPLLIVYSCFGMKLNKLQLEFWYMLMSFSSLSFALCTKLCPHIQLIYVIMSRSVLRQ